ncbi:Ltp family lipoprotein [Myceligenerans xiligouense]|uniref:Host cell surface-exposed lipoprotein n=1 Tax=Myceligenerans xiligouense TaxID=253184 RepID=A0A3N4ZJB3_9MICO|nr:Ltp family lipoprotein [Myceligenerans xiligouense]RPF20985.1 host cell surface-exposed lipoprotein [Myceligenerans xiligouense]
MSAIQPGPAPSTPNPAYGTRPPTPATNGAATASLVLGIVSLFLSLLFLPSVLGLVLGVVGANRAKRTTPPVGREKAVWGIVLSAVGLVLGIGLVALIGNAATTVDEAAQDTAVVQEDVSGDVADDDGDEASAESATADDGQTEEPVGKESADEESTPKKPAKEKPVAEEPAETVSQANARESAASYLDYTAFSKSGLVEQLEFEGFSTADAEYAVEQVEVDWMEQAVKAAQNYLDHTSFSRAGLVDQLEFEGFTPEQAAHGADAVGL